MGACLTTSEDLAKAQNSNNIDKQLAVEQNNYSKVIKVLLLGSGESGKSTIVKQMKIIHLDGYSKEELISFKYEIFRNVLESAKQILVAMDKIGAEVTDEQAKVPLCLHIYLSLILYYN
jgi:guanine nucleotide-binding protein G(i) subunit alpha